MACDDPAEDALLKNDPTVDDIAWDSDETLADGAFERIDEMAWDELSRDAVLNAAERLDDRLSEACETLATDTLLYRDEILDAIPVGLAVKAVLMADEKLADSVCDDIKDAPLEDAESDDTWDEVGAKRLSVTDTVCEKEEDTNNDALVSVVAMSVDCSAEDSGEAVLCVPDDDCSAEEIIEVLCACWELPEG